MDLRHVSVHVVASKSHRANGRMALEVTLTDGAHTVCADGITQWVRPSDAELREIFQQWLRQARSGVHGFVELPSQHEP